ACLVVLDDPARAEGVDVDSIDLSRQGDALCQFEPALQLRGRALRAEQHLEPARDERGFGGCILPHEGLEVAPETVQELALLKPGELHPDTLDRLVEAPAEIGDGVL